MAFVAELGIICGMASEARALGHWRTDARVSVRVTAGRPGVAVNAVAELTALGVRGLLSWGVCGALDPALVAGDLVICAPGEVHAADVPLVTAADKARAFGVGARIVDMESAALARSDLPGWVVRAVLDEAGADLPPPALVALRPDGTPDLCAIASALIRRPSDLAAMIGLARRNARALGALRAAAPRIGEFLEIVSEVSRGAR